MNRRVSWLKILLGFLALLAIAVYLVPRADPLLKPDNVIDGGPRGLIVFSTQGGNPNLKLTVKQYFDANGGGRVVFYFSADNLVWGTDSNLKEIALEVYFAGEAFRAASIVCGPDPGTPARELNWDQLSVGAKRAIEIDLGANRNSALNYAPSDREEQSSGSSSSQFLRSYTSKMWPLKSDSARVARQQTGGGYIYAEECAISDAAAWRYQSDESTFAESSNRTLLPFQINWTSIDERTDVHKDMSSLIVIDRSAGTTLTEAYPPPSANDDDWFYWNRISWSGKLGESANLAYTDQPVFMVSDRAESDRKSILMLWAGVLLGIAATIVVRIGSIGLELVADRVQRPEAPKNYNNIGPYRIKFDS